MLGPAKGDLFIRTCRLEQASRLDISVRYTRGYYLCVAINVLRGKGSDSLSICKYQDIRKMRPSHVRKNRIKYL